MIDPKCFSKEWLDSFKSQNEYKGIQTNILEKMIYALHLVIQLKRHGADFVFKGGTSLVLLLEEGNRFSIDIDIICKTNREQLEKILEQVVENSKFTAVALDERRSYKKGVPKAHYVFEFNSVFNSIIPGKILLDILIDGSIYPEHVEKAIETKWIENIETVIVKMPSINAITGDKLTAFAPNTIGIPYFKGNNDFAMEIIKQLFDLGRLFHHVSNMEVVAESFFSHAKLEISYREVDGKKTTPELVLRDIIETCLIITKKDLNKYEPEKSNFQLLQKGIKAFGTGYLMSGNFRIDDSIIAAACVAYLAAKILANDLNPIVYFKGEDIRPLIIEKEGWRFLNKLKRQPEKSSFYYWYHTVELLERVNY